MADCIRLNDIEALMHASHTIITMESTPPVISKVTDLHYSPPWADLSIIGIAGSSGSGKTSVATEIVKQLNLPWVVILVMVHCTLIHIVTNLLEKQCICTCDSPLVSPSNSFAL